MTTLEPGFYPFWFWNAELDEAEIRRQIDEMAAAGVKGFFIHSRQGLTVPYLSEAFLRLVQVAVAAAKERGLIVNLYDEYPYPSGVAGGAVVLGSPGLQATELKHASHDCGGGRVRLALPRGEILCCLACPVRGGRVDWDAALDCRGGVGMVLAEQSYVEMGLTSYNRKRFFASAPTPTLDTVLPEGSWRILVTAQVRVDRHKYWGVFVDTLNEQAIARFIELTHERYAAAFAADFGDTIRSIFVDETAPTWSPLLPPAFLREYGYDLLPLLPALACEEHPRHVRVTADFERLRARLFCRAFDEPLAAWCAAHGIAYLGEKPSYRLSQLRYMDVPGCDVGHTKAGAPTDVAQARLRGNARAAASAAYFYGKSHALCECFHSLGWGATMQDARLIVDELLLRGVDILVPHAFFYSTHGLRKHDAPPSFFFQMPYWGLWSRLSRRVQEVAAAFGGTWIDAAVLVVDPGPGVPTAAGKRTFERLMAELTAAHIEFLVADTDVLRAGRVEDGKLLVRDLAVTAVVVPPMRYVEPELESWLLNFERSGALVARLAEAPDWDALLAPVAEAAGSRLRIAATRGDARAVRLGTRTDGKKRVYFLLNSSREAVSLRLASDEALVEVPLEPGMPPRLSEAAGGYARTLGPFEAALLQSGRALSPPHAQVVRLRVGGHALVRPLGQNLLRLGRWALTLKPPGSDAEARPVEVSAAPIANQILEGRIAIAPEVRTFFGHEPELQLPRLQATYELELDSSYGGRVELVVEPDTIRGEWTVSVNGGRPASASDLGPSAAHVRGSQGLDVTGQLVQGLNRLTVTVITDRRDGGLVAPLYLAGDFGVSLEAGRPQLRERPPAGRFEDYRVNGLPFYSGTVEYRMQAGLARVPNEGTVLLELEFEAPFEEACELSLNGHGFRSIPWAPYRVAVPAAELREGENDVVLRVHTSLIRTFEGQRFDPAAHAYVAV